MGTKTSGCSVLKQKVLIFQELPSIVNILVVVKCVQTATCESAWNIDVMRGDVVMINYHRM